MTEKEKMLSGKLYVAGGEELAEEFRRAKRLTREFNATTEEELEKRKEILRKLFASVGEDVYIEPTFKCDYGCHIYIGNHFYANYDCIIIDVCDVIIGDNVFLAPRVGIYTAGHPIDAAVRNQKLEYGKPITIGDSVWIGGNAVINPGVRIGSNVVIGSGSVVTKDIPDGVVAAGNPCRVLRRITEADQAYWQALAKEEHDESEYNK